MARPLTTAGDMYGPDMGFSFADQYTRTDAQGNITAQADTATSTSTALSGGSPNYGIQVIPVLQGLQGSILGYPVTWAVLIFATIFLYKYIEEKRSSTRAEFQEIKIGLHNWWKVGLFAVTFLILFNFLITKYQVPGLSGLRGLT